MNFSPENQPIFGGKFKFLKVPLSPMSFHQRLVPSLMSFQIDKHCLWWAFKLISTVSDGLFLRKSADFSKNTGCTIKNGTFLGQNQLILAPLFFFLAKISWFFEKYRVFHKKWYFFGQNQLILRLFFFFFGQNQLIFRKIQGVPYKMVLFLLKIGHFLKKGPSISYKIAFFPFLKLMDGPQTPKRAIFRKFTGCSIRDGTFLVKICQIWT